MTEWLKGNAARPIRFAGVGGVATLVHMGTAALLLWIFPALPAAFVNLLAFMVAFLVSFYGHRHLTFYTRGRMHRFLIVALCGFALNNVILYVALASSIPKLIAIIIATACVPVVTYLASALWAFREK
ncbi:GtrA family protein [Martelella sp. FLE1502]